MIRPQLVTRAGWGARPPRTRDTVTASRRTGFMGHYDGGAPLTQDHAGCPARVRADQAFHMGARGWSDIGYNFLVCQHGVIYEGRGWDVIGAHCIGFNTSDIGVQVMIGGGQAPSPAAMAAYWWLYAQACARSRRALARRGHLDGMSTLCPGDRLYALIQAGPPTTPPPPPAQEDDMTPAQIASLFAKVDYISAQCKALGNLHVLYDARDRARDDAELAAINGQTQALLAAINAAQEPEPAQ